MIKELSPTSVNLFYKDIDAFYSRYLSPIKKVREPQTRPMSIGASFDAYAKSYLHKALFGHYGDFEFSKIFEAQVKPINRDWAFQEGKYVFEQYKEVALADLMIELEGAIGNPRMEFSISGIIEDVPLMGKPDLFFINKEGARVIYDWKVNGYCSNSLTSPVPGYIKLRERSKLNNQIVNKVHKDCFLLKKNGIYINGAITLEKVKEDWAEQLCIYSWLLGEPIGSENMITGIEQICGPKERLRFASHRLGIDYHYQNALIENVKYVWEVVQSGYYFRNLSLSESVEYGKLLDQSGNDPMFRSLTNERF